MPNEQSILWFDIMFYTNWPIVFHGVRIGALAGDVLGLIEAFLLTLTIHKRSGRERNPVRHRCRIVARDAIAHNALHKGRVIRADG